MKCGVWLWIHKNTGFNLSKEELHEKYWEITKDENYIFPDILNPDYQNLLLDLAKAQIDAGVDAIWIDGFFWQAKIFASLANTTKHKAIEGTFKAINKIVDEIHEYGLSKDKYIYVGSWAQTDFPYQAPKLDFVTMSPSPEEIREKKLNELRWMSKINKVKEKYGDIPIIAFIDWAFTKDTPLGVFSQELTPEEQREVLRIFDEFLSEKGVIFAYPVHGGYMDRDATILSFGASYLYDALAPEFQTYKTIKEIAHKRSGILEISGTVKYIPLEGGFYGIIGDDGNKYLPLNLPEKYMVDGLKIWIWARIRRDLATIYMWGTPIEIIEVKASLLYNFKGLVF